MESEEHKKFREQGEALKKKEVKVDDTAKSERVGEAEVNSAIATLASLSGETANFFKDNAQVGAENLSGSMAQLKITEGTSNNEGPDGRLVAPGNFYYSPTKESFKELEVSIVTMSRGFYSMDQSTPPRPKFSQLVGGIILEGMKPFIMFVSSKRLNGLWDFGKEIAPFTRNKNMPVPMMAFRVKLTLKRETNEKGQPYHVVNYELLKNAEGQIQITTDIDTLNFFKKSVIQFEDTFESFMEKKEINRDGSPVNKEATRLIETDEYVPGEEVFHTEEAEVKPVVDDDGIPF